MSTSASGVIPIEYITISGSTIPLPNDPFMFNDTLILKTDDELRKMDIKDLMKYSSSISTSISMEVSTLLVNQRVQGRYLRLKLESQRIIDNLDNEIAINKALLDSLTDFGDLTTYDTISTSYISTLAQYNFYIAEQNTYMTYYNSTLSSYMNIYSELEAENDIFTKAATQYSSLYLIYYGFQTQYDDVSSELNAVTMSLEDAKGSEQSLYKALEESTLRLHTITETLTNLRVERDVIQEKIIYCKGEESRTFREYKEAIESLNRISSIYEAAVANEEYALSMSTTVGVTTDHSDKVEQFNAAELLYKVSIPAGTGGENAVSGAVLGNSALWAARQMAERRVLHASDRRVAVERRSESLLTLADLANTEAYKTMLSGYDELISIHASAEQEFASYKLSSLERVAQYSSIFEVSLRDIDRYSSDVIRFSSFYESSIIGASTLLYLSERDLSTIEGDTKDYYAVSWSISTLNEQYSTFTSEFNTAVENSTIYHIEYLNLLEELEKNTEYYASTNKSVVGLTYDLFGTSGSNGLINIYNNTVFIYSSILNKELISQKIYETEMKKCLTLQDISMYQYRETYCRSTRFVYQKDYELKVFAEVQYAQSLTDAQQANSPPGVSVIPVVANLATRTISASYSNLVSIYSFLDYFDDIYTTYDSQIFTIDRLSTSVGNESASWSTLDFYTKAQYANRAWAIRTYGSNLINAIPSYITAACDSLTLAQESTSMILNTYTQIQGTIDKKKEVIISSLGQFYSATEIQDQTTTISSFIISSILEARELLESE